MKKNMGTTDRVIRVVVALIAAILIFSGILKGAWAIVAGVVAGIFLLTSLVSFCPLYTLVGINTCKRTSH
ncbi:DUF2892 domain-containing protein [Fluviicola sp.]|uniref:YgaP family membrane protein n=1 Tax=Fluviicola sp. TaxID=1917219 RepID=UPI0031DC19DB